MRPSVKLTLLRLSIALVAVSCDQSEETRKRIAAENQKGLPQMVRPGIVAGPGERTLEENYGLKISLPMPEGQFIGLLSQLKLSYEIRAERPGLIPRPDRCHDLDLRRIQKVYRLYGNLNEAALRSSNTPARFSGMREIYYAYIDAEGNVVCIENGFMYEGP